jgi:hypothetical protein
MECLRDIDESVYLLFPMTEFTQTMLININTTLNFTGIKRVVIEHNGSKFIWVNGTQKCIPYIIAPVKIAEFDELFEYSKSKALNDILEYLSLLTVRFGTKVEMNPNTFKNYYGRMDMVLPFHDPWINRIDEYIFEVDYIPVYNQSLTQEESKMIALFRDSITSNSIFYSILSCFKIFEFYFSTKIDRYNWIDLNFNEAKTFAFQTNVIRGTGDWDKFLAFVNVNNMSKGDYLYKNCRCAIAHANSSPIVNPNIFSDYYEMYYSNEVIKVLAWYLILEKLDSKLHVLRT